jgi:signal transduction histidine kinase
MDTGVLTLDATGGIPSASEKDFLDCPLLHLLPANSPEILVLNSIQARSEPEYASLRNAGLSALVGIPLLVEGRNLGLLCFATSSREVIAADETDLVMTIAQYLATALDRETTNRQLHKAKEELGEHAQLLEARVQERTARLRETISELETFSYTIAHDLRAPARGMAGYCDVLLEDFAESLSPAARSVVQKIARASSRMEMLTRDLLEFSRISTEEIVLAPVEIESLIEDLAALRLPEVRKAITVHTPLHPVRAHPGLLQHVFSNLIDNAVKFVQPETPPRITIFTELVSHGSPNTRSRPLFFSSTEQPSAEVPPVPEEKPPQHVRIWVLDEGIGIPREAHQKIFGIFERGPSADVYEGTGIGLAIVARAMQRMGGTCGVGSEPGKGSRFWLDLPAP